MKPLRLLIVTRRFWPLVGGPEKTLARLAVELTKRGCATSVLTARWHPRWPAEISYQSVPVTRLAPVPDGRWKTWRYLRAIGRWLRANEGRFDLVYVSMLGHEAATAVQSLAGRVPVVLRAEHSGRYGDCLWQIEAREGRRIKNQCLRAAAFAAPTPPIQRELEAAGYARQRIHYLPPGVPIPPARAPRIITAARAMLADAHNMLQLTEGARVALYLGRLAPGQGLEHLIAAWPPIAQRWPGARLWLAGPSSDGGAIRRQIDRLSLTDRVVPLGVFDEVDGLLAAADLVVAPAPAGAPIALLEAMAAGLPVVAADVAANRWLMTEGQDGLLVPPGDARPLSVAIARVFEQPELAARLGAAARDRVAREFTLAKMVDEHLTLFHNL